MNAECYGGGTALGSVQVYAAEQLDQLHGMPTEVHGTSVGSLTAACRAAGALRELRHMWATQVKGSRSFQALNFPDIWNGLFSLRPLRRMIRDILHPGMLMTDCYAHIVDLGSKRYERVMLNGLSMSDMEDALVASCSQVGIHEASPFQGRLKGDGGISHVLPHIRPERGLTAVWAVACSPITSPGRDHPLDQRDIGLSRPLEMLVDTVERADYQHLRILSEHGVEVWLVQPQERPGDPFDASSDTNLWRMNEVGPSAWARRIRVTGRPGLHLSPDQHRQLQTALFDHGVELDAVLSGIRRDR